MTDQAASRRAGGPASAPGRLFWRALAAALLAFFTIGCHDARAFASGGTPAFERAARLEHSIAIWRWFERPAQDSDAHYRGYVSDDDLKALRGWGFTAVRLPVGEEFLFGDGAYGAIRGDRIALLKQAIARINAAGLAVVVDFHPSQHNKGLMGRDAAMRQKTVAFWRRFAADLADTDPDKVFLELLNEPHFRTNPALWNVFLRQMWKAVRSATPRHAVIISAAHYGDIDMLDALAPLDDDDVIYTVHFYRPHVFVAQGAPSLPATIEGVPWPSSKAACKPAAARITRAAQDSRSLKAQLKGEKSAPTLMRDYCASNSGANTVRRDMKKIADWSAKRGAPVWIGEFGVHAPQAPRADRLAWLHSVASAADDFHVPWSLWSYDDCFGVSIKLACGGEQSVAQRVAFSCDTLHAIGLGGSDCAASMRPRLGGLKRQATDKGSS